MNDLIQLFRNFIYRDLAFILGGSIVIGSILYALKDCAGIDINRLQTQPYLLFLLVLAYVVGYTVQDIGAVLPLRLTFTGYVLQPNRFCQSLYRRFTGSSWTPLSYAGSPEEARQFALHMNRLAIPDATLRDLDRILSLKVISMCVGGCSTMSALILFGTWIFNRSAAWIAAVLLLILGVALICLGWVKALQQMQFYEAVKAEKFGMKKIPELK